MRTESAIVCTAIAISFFFASLAESQEIEARFSEFRLGDRCATLIAAMPEPMSTEKSATLWVAHSRIRWVAGSQVYVAVCVMDRLISKRVCHSVPDC